MNVGTPASPTALLEMGLSFWIGRALYAMAKLGIADQIGPEGRSAGDLAQATGCHAPSLYRAMRLLASVGVFDEVATGTFKLTPLGHFLRADAAMSQRATMIMLGEPWHWSCWGEVLHSIRTGEPAIVKTTGKRMFEYFATDREAFQVFHATMMSFAAPTHAATVPVYDWGSLQTLTDVGGGLGSHLALILEANPRLRGTVYDLPEVAANAKRLLASRGLGERSAAVAGDFFAEVPAGSRGYLLSHILHDWYDEDASRILRNIRRAMPQDGRLLIVETVIPPGNAPSLGKLFDLEMLVLVGGKERTEEEYRDLLRRSGFRTTRVISTQVAESVIEAAPA